MRDVDAAVADRADQSAEGLLVALPRPVHERPEHPLPPRVGAWVAPSPSMSVALAGKFDLWWPRRRGGRDVEPLGVVKNVSAAAPGLRHHSGKAVHRRTTVARGRATRVDSEWPGLQTHGSRRGQAEERGREPSPHRQPCCGWPRPAGRACQRRTGRREEPRACAPRRPVVAQGHRRRRQVHLREPGLGGSARTGPRVPPDGPRAPQGAADHGSPQPRRHRRHARRGRLGDRDRRRALPPGDAGRPIEDVLDIFAYQAADPDPTDKDVRPTRARATRTGSPRCPTATS